MNIPVNPSSNNRGIIIPPRVGASRLLLQNPVNATADLYFHQGFPVKYGEVPTGSPATAMTGETTVNETGSGTGSLAPGESVMLNFSTPVWVNPSTNEPASVNATPLA